MTEKGKRDDFLESTKKLLHNKVNGLCSKPDCRILTSGPNSKVDKTTSIGQAAHITAAAKGGPRYNSALSTKQRKSYENGIWLCNNHARQIDTDAEKFPVGMLKEWKIDTEKYIEKNLGKPLITQEEADSLADKKIANIFIGENFHSLTNAATKVISHIDSKFSDLDPRFTVKTDIIDGSTVQHIYSKNKDTSVTFSISEHHSQEFSQKFNNFQKFGDNFEFPADQITVNDSELFKHIFKNIPEGSKVSLSRPDKTLNAELYASLDDNPVFLGNSKVKLKYEKDSYVMTATALKDFVLMRSIHRTSSNQAEFKYSFDFSKWEGIDVQKIPYFPKLKKIIPILSKGGGFFLEIDGGEAGLLISGDTKWTDDRSVLNDLLFVLLYVDKARIIGKALDTPITYNLLTTSQEKLQELNQISLMLENPIEAEGNEINGNAKLTLVNENKNSYEKMLKMVETAKCLNICESSETQEIFGKKIKIPSINHEFFDIKITIDSTKTRKDGSYKTKVTISNNQNTKYRKSLEGFSTPNKITGRAVINTQV